jgi:nitrite reductase (NADH) small subunit
MKTKLARSSDIPEGKSILVKTSDGLEIVLFKFKGEIFALENACPHKGGPLAEGEIEGGIVTCPWHGWQFEVQTGSCQNMPGEEAHKFELKIIDDDIYLG